MSFHLVLPISFGRIRKTFRLVGLALSLVMLGSLVAHADTTWTTGTIDFKVTSGGPAPTGYFMYNDNTHIFTVYKVNWNGVVYNNLAPSADAAGLAAVIEPGSWCAEALVTGCPGPGGQFEATFNMPFGWTVDSGGTFTVGAARASGTFTVVDLKTTTVPEPSAIFLFGTGLLALGPFVRRRGRSRRNAKPKRSR